MITALQTCTLVLLGRIAVGPTTCVDAVYCYRPSSVVCRSVCLSVCHTSPAKMVEPIEMPFGLCTRVGSRNHVLHRVSKNVPPLACYNVDAHEWILIFFGGNVTDKVGNQKTLYYATLSNLCFYTTWQNAETRKSHFTQLDCVTHTMHLCAIFLKEKKLSSVMCLIGSKISH